jgi:hypothetical protein
VLPSCYWTFLEYKLKKYTKALLSTNLVLYSLTAEGPIEIRVGTAHYFRPLGLDHNHSEEVMVNNPGNHGVLDLMHFVPARSVPPH